MDTNKKMQSEHYIASESLNLESNKVNDCTLFNIR